MMWPSWLRRRKPAPNPHVITITIDTSAFVAAMKQAAAAMRAPAFAVALARAKAELKALEKSMEQVKAAIDNRSPSARMAELEARQREVARAGYEARWYVRGGMDPTYAHPDARDQTVRDLADLGCYTYAAEFIRGWVTHHEETG